MIIWNVCTEERPNIIDDIVLAVDEKSLTLSKVANANDVISKTKQAGNQAAVCFKKDSMKSEELRLLFMCMISNNDFSIIEVDELSDIDMEYAESVLEYQVEVNELKIILGEELGGFAAQLLEDTNNPINNLVTSLINTTLKTVSTGSTETVQVSKELNDKIYELERNLSDVRMRYAELTSKAENYKKCVDEQALVIKRQNSELGDTQEQLKAANDKLSNLGNFGKQTSNVVYAEMNLDRIRAKMVTQHARIDVEHVIYFKELTPCSYINSFITNFIQYLRINKKKNVICLIYDDSEFNRYKYGKLTRLNGTNFVANQSLKDETLVVVTDAAPQILEEALITHNVVLVYDRMGANNDVIVGRNVHKFVVVNSIKEMLEIRRETQIDSEHFLTTFGTDKNTLSIRQIRDYKQMSQGGRLMSYANMTCTKNNSTTIFEQLLFTASIALDTPKESL